MNEWKKVKIGDVLTERVGRYKPNDSLLEKYKRIEKIDFAGNIFISNKPSKTDMILVYPNDLIISGINVYKGAFAVYCGDEIVSATIHYSSYIFNSNLLYKDYFAYFLKSSAFLDILKKQVKGGIKTEIKAKTFLQLEIMLPDIDEQKHIVSNLSNKLGKIENLTNENEKQSEYIKKLRQSILQDAIEGKLTVEWRKDNPVIKGNPDFDAESLFEKIQQEKQKAQAGKKQKQLPPIADNEKAFEIPDSWKWVRLGEIIELISGQDLEPSKYNDKEEGVPYLTGASNFEEGRIIINRWTRFPKSIARKNDILLTCKGSCGEVAIADFDEAHIARQIMAVRSISILSFKYLELLIKSLVEHIKSQAKGLIPGIERNTVLSIPCAIPPLKEQEEIVRIIDEKFAKLDLIEQEIKQRESYINSLKRSIMEEVFEGE